VTCKAKPWLFVVVVFVAMYIVAAYQLGIQSGIVTKQVPCYACTFFCALHASYWNVLGLVNSLIKENLIRLAETGILSFILWRKYLSDIELQLYTGFCFCWGMIEKVMELPTLYLR